jgi:hypothetical protein
MQGPSKALPKGPYKALSPRGPLLGLFKGPLKDLLEERAFKRPSKGLSLGGVVLSLFSSLGASFFGCF